MSVEIVTFHLSPGDREALAARARAKAAALGMTPEQWEAERLKYRTPATADVILLLDRIPAKLWGEP